MLSRVRLLATPWTAAHQASPSMEFSRQEYYLIPKFKSAKQEIFGEVLLFTTKYQFLLVFILSFNFFVFHVFLLV